MGKSRRNTNLKPMMIATCHWRATFYSKEITVVISWVGGFARFNTKRFNTDQGEFVPMCPPIFDVSCALDVYLSLTFPIIFFPFSKIFVNSYIFKHFH